MITFHIPGPLREFTAGAATVTLDDRVGTIGEALERLGRTYPGVRDRVLDERGAVRRHVNVFIGVENIRDCGGLGAALPRHAEVSILQNVSGG